MFACVGSVNVLRVGVWKWGAMCLWMLVDMSISYFSVIKCRDLSDLGKCLFGLRVAEGLSPDSRGNLEADGREA